MDADSIVMTMTTSSITGEPGVHGISRVMTWSMHGAVAEWQRDGSVVQRGDTTYAMTVFHRPDGIYSSFSWGGGNRWMAWDSVSADPETYTGYEGGCPKFWSGGPWIAGWLTVTRMP
jgi:hypothetical protein